MATGTPRQVLEQAEAAERMLAERSRPAQNGDTDADTEPGNAQPSADPQSAQNPPQDQQAPDQVHDAPPENPEAVRAEAPEQSGSAGDGSDSETTGQGDGESLEQKLAKAEHRISVLRGKLDKELPRLANENKVLRNTVAMLQQVGAGSVQQNAQPQAAPQAQAAPQQAPQDDGGGEVDLRSIYSDEEISDYGEEFLRKQQKLISAVSERVARQAVAPLATQFQQNRVSDFVSRVRSRVQDFDRIDDSDEWDEYLSLPVSPLLPGVTRREALQRAAVDGDVERAVSMYSDFTGGAAQAQGTPPQAQRTPAQPAPSSRVSEQVVPSQRSVGPPPQKAAKKVYSPAEYMELTNKLTSRQIRGQAADELNKELVLAVQEGRVRLG